MTRRIIPLGVKKGGPVILPALSTPTLAITSQNTSTTVLQATYTGTLPPVSQYVFQKANALGGPYSALATQAGSSLSTPSPAAGVSTYFRVAVIVNDGRQSIWSPILTVTGGSTGATRIFVPGHYCSPQAASLTTGSTFTGLSHGGTVSGTYPNQVATGGDHNIAGCFPPGITAVMWGVDWNVLDLGGGSYDWSKLDIMMAQCTAMGVGLFLRINTRTFNASINPMPPDLVSFSEVFTVSGGGVQGWRWAPEVLKREQTFYLAVAARYGSWPAFYGIATQETSTSGANGSASNASSTVALAGGLGNYTGYDAYAPVIGGNQQASGINYTAGLICQAKIIANAFPKGRPMLYTNFIAGAPQGTNASHTGETDFLNQYAAAAQPLGALWGGPDLVMTGTGPGSAAAVANRAYPTYTNYQNGGGAGGIANKGATFCSVQPSEWLGGRNPVTGTPADIREIYNWGLGNNTAYPANPAPANSPLNLSIIVWTYGLGPNSNGQDWSSLSNVPNGAASILVANPTLRSFTPSP